MINLTKTEQQLTDEMTSKINLSKDKEVLGSHIINLSKTVINLSKEANIDLGDTKARVVVILDYSGSMKKLYNDGTVQRTLNRLVPLGLKFDDNGSIDTYVFRDDFIKLADLNIDNYEKYVDKEIKAKVEKYGRTVYSPVLNDVYNTMCNQKGFINFIKRILGLHKKTDPILVLFITDGGDENGDYVSCDNVIRKLSEAKTFIQFIGIGDNKFKYFDRLPKITGKATENTGSTIIKDLNNVTDDTLYRVILKDFAKWIM